MGRKKIIMDFIKDNRNRKVTFKKRLEGIKKKGYEVGILCNIKMAMIFYDGGKLYTFSSGADMDEVLLRYANHEGHTNATTGADMERTILQNERKKSRGGQQETSPEDTSPELKDIEDNSEEVEEERQKVLDQQLQRILPANKITELFPDYAGPSSSEGCASQVPHMVVDLDNPRKGSMNQVNGGAGSSAARLHNIHDTPESVQKMRSVISGAESLPEFSAEQVICVTSADKYLTNLDYNEVHNLQDLNFAQVPDRLYDNSYLARTPTSLLNTPTIGDTPFLSDLDLADGIDKREYI